MKVKNLRPLKLDGETAGQIAKAVYIYADAAYPPGGSECAQATNQALKELAGRISRSTDQAFILKKRQLPLIKAAIRWYYSEDVQPEPGVDPEKLILKLK